MKVEKKIRMEQEIAERKRLHRNAYMRRYKREHKERVYELRRAYEEKKKARYRAALEAWTKEALANTTSYAEFIKYPGRPRSRPALTAAQKAVKAARERLYRKKAREMRANKHAV